jgi:hypothetical protein
MTPDLSQYFIDSAGRDVPLLVENATGEPKFAIVGNQYVPYDEWKAKAHPSRPAPSQPLTIRSADGTFSASLSVN